MISFMVLLVACGPAAPTARWTVDGALAPTYAAVDTDHNGAISEPEYARVAFSGPKFAEADASADGQLDAGEFRTLVLDADPLTFHAKAYDGKIPGSKKKKSSEGGSGPAGTPGGSAPAPGGPGGPPGPGKAPGTRPGGPGGPGAGPGVGPGVGPGGPVSTKRKGPGRMPDAYYVFQIMREEVLAADPGARVPDVGRVTKVGAAGSFHSNDAKTLEREFEVAYAAAGLTYPERLRASAAITPATAGPPDGDPGP